MNEQAQFTKDVLRLGALYGALGPNGRRILMRLAERLAAGAKQYPDDFAIGRRNWDREAIEELLDAAVYLEARTQG